VGVLIEMQRSWKGDLDVIYICQYISACDMDPSSTRTQEAAFANYAGVMVMM
jgi:hypothetical protein